MKVSVIIPTYNRHSFLRQSIASFLSQDYDNKELIVVNDGGDVPNVPEEITLYNIKHGNQAITQNYGIEKATGDLICTLDDDDLFYDNYSLTHRVQAFIDDPTLEVIWSTGINMHSDGKPSTEHKLVDGSEIMHRDDILINSLMWRNSIDKKIGGWFDTNLTSNEDWDFKIRCINKCKCKGLDIKTVKHRVHGEMRSLLHRQSGELGINANKIMEKYK